MILFKTIHKDFVSSWSSYKKTSSVKKGARWNNVGSPVMYTSANAQNAMLEIANYIKSPKIVNKLYRLAVFEFPEIKMHTINPDELPSDWDHLVHQQDAKDLGDKYLLDPQWEGILVPSATINSEVATHSINAVRQSVYANVVVNIENIGVERIKLLDDYTPIYSPKMFN